VNRGSGSAGIGLPIDSGSVNSVLFVNPAGTLAQDNANFTYTVGTTTFVGADDQRERPNS
jgi:hypothetical protein